MRKKETADCGPHCLKPTWKFLGYHCKCKKCHGKPVPGHYRKTKGKHRK